MHHQLRYSSQIMDSKSPPRDNQMPRLIRQQEVVVLTDNHSRSSGGGNKPLTVGMHYRVGKKIGEGSFGTIHVGRCTLTQRPVAIKFEVRTPATPQLAGEWRSYKILETTACSFPRVYYYGSEGAFWCLVMDLEGPSVEAMFEKANRRFTIPCVCALAINMKGLIYRDIKPDNFLLALDTKRDQQILRLIDFGMAKWYCDPKSSQHIPYREKKSLSGTARYMSINTHLGREQSRRDDLESLGHVFFYLARGSLPWQRLKANGYREKCEMIASTKQNTSFEDLCKIDGHSTIPNGFACYLSYARGLAFDQTPDYEQCKSFFYQIIAPSPLSYDFDPEVTIQEFLQTIDANMILQNNLAADGKAQEIKCKRSFWRKFLCFCVK